MIHYCNTAIAPGLQGVARARTQPGAATWAKALLRFLVTHFHRLGLNQAQIQRLRKVAFIPASDLRTAPLPPLWCPPQIAKHLLKAATPSGSMGGGSGGGSGGKRKGKKGSSGSRGAAASGSKGGVDGGAMALLDEVGAQLMTAVAALTRPSTRSPACYLPGRPATVAVASRQTWPFRAAGV